MLGTAWGWVERGILHREHPMVQAENSHPPVRLGREFGPEPTNRSGCTQWGWRKLSACILLRPGCTLCGWTPREHRWGQENL